MKKKKHESKIDRETWKNNKCNRKKRTLGKTKGWFTGEELSKLRKNRQK
jgi:hypothetical protein